MTQHEDHRTPKAENPPDALEKRTSSVVAAQVAAVTGRHLLDLVEALAVMAAARAIRDYRNNR